MGQKSEFLMYMVRGLVCILLLVCSGVHPSYGETYVIDVYDLDVGVNGVAAGNFFDLGAEIVGITAVSLRVVGVGGGGNFECQSTGPDGWYDLDVKISFGNDRFGFSTSNQVGFDVIASELESEPNPWSVCEGTTRCSIPVASHAQGDPNYDCWATDVVLPVISHVEVTITAESVVSANSVSWGTVKALYSGGR